jgi:hypothetical protein
MQSTTRAAQNTRIIIIINIIFTLYRFVNHT